MLPTIQLTTEWVVSRARMLTFGDFMLLIQLSSQHLSFLTSVFVQKPVVVVYFSTFPSFDTWLLGCVSWAWNIQRKGRLIRHSTPCLRNCWAKQLDGSGSDREPQHWTQVFSDWIKLPTRSMGILWTASGRQDDRDSLSRTKCNNLRNQNNTKPTGPQKIAC